MLQRADVAEVLAAEARRGRSRTITRLVMATVAILVVGAGGFWLWSAWRGASTVTYLTDAVARGNITVSITATGTLEPTSTVQISSLLTGTITAVSVDFNDTVAAGQELARLDSTDLDASYRRAQAAADLAAANVDVARTGLEDAQAALRRAEELDRNRLISSRDLELAGTAYSRAKASMAAAEAQSAAALADLEAAAASRARTIIAAPVDGIVLDMTAELGQTVGPTLTSPLFVIASDLAKLDLKVDIDEADIPQVALGDLANFTVEAAPDQLHDGFIRQVHSGPKVTSGVTTYVAVIATDNADLMLKPGMTATAEILTDEAKDVLTVANSALRFVPAGESPPAEGLHVYVLADGAPRLVTVTTGITNGQRTQITGGDLKDGDLAITGIGGR